ncbi:MAG: Uma2 family endonuclease [Acidobacteriota bacterium]|jgi:Uma2 family endonuclease|nr:Uma2 family endonuclease [Acidobacteriota bacterium]
MLTTVVNRAGAAARRPCGQPFSNPQDSCASHRHPPARRAPHTLHPPRHSPVAPQQDAAAARTVARIERRLERGGVGRVFRAPCDILFDKGVVVRPDVFFVHGRRRGAVGSWRGRERLYGVPDLVIDLRPGAAPLADGDLRRRVYARFGVPELWWVDPGRRSVETFLWSEWGYVATGVRHETERVGLARCPELRLSLDGVFR